MSATLSPAVATEIESAILQAIRTLVRVMNAAADRPDAPLPRPLTQARLAATQVLRFAAQVLGAPPVKRLAAPDTAAVPPTPASPSRAVATRPMRTAHNFLQTAGSEASLRRTG